MKREVGGALDAIAGIMFLFTAGVGFLSYVLVGESKYIGSMGIVVYTVIGTMFLLTRYSKRVRRRVHSVRENLYVQATLATIMLGAAVLFFVIGGVVALIFGVVSAIVGLETIYNLARHGTDDSSAG